MIDISIRLGLGFMFRLGQLLLELGFLVRVIFGNRVKVSVKFSLGLGLYQI